jgi:hypothetical protein
MEMSQLMASENTTRISNRVLGIMGFPNIMIVVGRDATLVVDTGLGPKSRAIAPTSKRSIPTGPTPMLQYS